MEHQLNQLPTLSYMIARVDRIISKLLNETPKAFRYYFASVHSIVSMRQKEISPTPNWRSVLLSNPNQTNKILQDLLSSGWISKESDPSHGRRICHVTQAGLNKLSECRAVVQELEQTMLKAWILI